MADDGSKGQQSFVLKVLVIGDTATGKTAIIKRYVTNQFIPKHKATVGVDFHLKTLSLGDKSVKLQLWDIAGQDKFGAISRVYYKDAVGVIIVYDVTRHLTFETVTKWKKEIDEKVQFPDGSPLPAILLGNKCDLDTQAEVDKDLLDRFCTEKGFLKWFDVSAKANVNIDKAARFLVERILDKQDALLSKRRAAEATFQPGVGSKGAKGSGCC